MKSIPEILSTYRKKNGLLQQDLAKLLNENGIQINYKNISNWECGKSEPSIEIFLNICRILKVEDIYSEFFGFNDLDKYGRLNEKGKEKLDDYAELLLDNEKYVIPSESKVIPFTGKQSIRLKSYYTLVSAGVGNYLAGDDYEELDFPADLVPEGADYTLTITGDSMEPVYTDKQKVFVHAQDYLNNGEIGIFSLDDNVYIKKLQDDDNGHFLVSLNKKYDPIPINENSNFMILGKVL